MAEWIGSAIGAVSENWVLSHVWELSISVSAMILFLILIRPFMKRLPRIGMYLLWVLIVVHIVAPFSVSGVYNLLPEGAGKWAAEVRQSIGAEQCFAWLTETGGEDAAGMDAYGGIQNSYRLDPKKIHSGSSENTVQGADKAASKISEGENNAELIRAAQASSIAEMAKETASAKASVDPGSVLVIIWFGGVLFCALYVVSSLIMNRKMLRHAVHLSDNVYEHPYACSSFVGGILFPKIYVPKGLREKDREYILLHERMHIRRWDYRMKPFAFLVFSLLWFNPLVWIAYRLMVRDMEVSCDEMVIGAMDSAARKRYSYLLLAMASGENGILCQNTAFGAGAVNERIHNIMKYKKPTKCITMALVLAVLLCGCGMYSAPGEAAGNASPALTPEKEAVYVEQTMQEGNIDWGGEDKVLAATNISTDPEGAFVQMGTVFAIAKNGARKIDSYGKISFADGKWQKAEIDWEETCKKAVKEKEIELSEGFYGADGSLYLILHKYPTQYYEDGLGEKYLSLKKQYLLRVDEKTGEIKELPVPTENWKDVFGDDARSELANGLAYNDYAVFADGNYLVYDGGGISAVYSGATGEKAADVSLPNNALSEIEAGDDFLCWAAVNQDTKQVEVRVIDENGENEYVLDTGISYEEGVFPGIALGAKDNVIVMATENGIFEAEYGDDEFTVAASPEKDNLYYLSGNGYKPCGRIVKGGAEDYILELVKNENSEKEEQVWCHYTKSE